MVNFLNVNQFIFLEIFTVVLRFIFVLVHLETLRTADKNSFRHFISVALFFYKGW